MKKILRIVSIAVMTLLVIMAIGGTLVFLYLYNNGLSGLYNNTEPKAGQIKVACVGDSITYGHSVSKWSKNNYPAVLQEILGDEYHVANFGVSGACVSESGNKPYTSRTVYEESLKYEPDILVIMLGSNDSKPRNWTNIETFLKEYQELLDTYLEQEKCPKVYIGICAKSYYVNGRTNGPAKYSIQPDIVDQIAVALKEKYAKEDVVIVDINDLTSQHPEWFEKDGIHPNKYGANAIANEVAKKIKQTYSVIELS